MSVSLAYRFEDERIARLENEVDLIQGKPPRNLYKCSICHDFKQIDESYHGSPSYVKCHGCDGGRLTQEANEKLMTEYHERLKGS